MIPECISSLEKIISHLKTELSSLQIGRASAGMVEEITVESYGTQMNLKSVANISCPDSHTIRIEPWDKNMVPIIEKAILTENLGLMPQNMGGFLFIPVPPMTEERRKQVVKKVGEIAEEAKIAVRNVRQDFFKKIKAQKENKEISEDEQNRQEKKIQEEVDKTNKKIEELSREKEKEILTI